MYLEFPLYCMCSIYGKSLHCSPTSYGAFLLSECLCSILPNLWVVTNLFQRKELDLLLERNVYVQKGLHTIFWISKFLSSAYLEPELRIIVLSHPLPPLLLIHVRIYVLGIVLNALDSISYFTLITPML